MLGMLCWFLAGTGELPRNQCQMGQLSLQYIFCHETQESDFQTKDQLFDGTREARPTDFPPQNSGFLARLRALICFGGGGSKSNAIFPNLICPKQRIFAIIPVWKISLRKNYFCMRASPLTWKINKSYLLRHNSKNCAILPSEKILKSFANLLKSNLPKFRVVPFSTT